MKTSTAFNATGKTHVRKSKSIYIFPRNEGCPETWIAVYMCYCVHICVCMYTYMYTHIEFINIYHILKYNVFEYICVCVYVCIYSILYYLVRNYGLSLKFKK